MLEKLKQIDTSAIEKLVNIKNEQDQINGYLEKAGEMKEKVDEVVYQRVRDDYQSRHRALEEEAGPLKTEARQEFRKLSELYDQFTTALDEAQANKQEVEFRHSVGELSDEDAEERLKEAEQVLEQCEQEVAEGDQLKDRFFEAFHSKEELENEPAPAEPAPDCVEPASPPPNPVNVSPEVEAAGEYDDVGDATMVAPEGNPGGMFQDSPSRETSEPPTQDPTATVVVRSARLTIEDEGKEFPLGPFNEIGRVAENQIQLKYTGVSKKHVLITATPEGYTAKDLNSRNGTYVNGKKIIECGLSNGDRIRIGEVQLVFHMT